MTDVKEKIEIYQSAKERRTTIVITNIRRETRDKIAQLLLADIQVLPEEIVDPVLPMEDPTEKIMEEDHKVTAPAPKETPEMDQGTDKEPAYMEEVRKDPAAASNKALKENTDQSIEVFVAAAKEAMGRPDAQADCMRGVIYTARNISHATFWTLQNVIKDKGCGTVKDKTDKEYSKKLYNALRMLNPEELRQLLAAVIEPFE